MANLAAPDPSYGGPIVIQSVSNNNPSVIINSASYMSNVAADATDSGGGTSDSVYSSPI